MTHKIIITGASGFIGQRLLKILSRNNHEIVAVGGSNTIDDLLVNNENIIFQAIDFTESTVDLATHLDGCDSIIHLAGYAHVSKVNKDMVERVNIRATGKLAQAAASAGVQRFVFLSTVKVNGDGQGFIGHDALVSYSESDSEDPRDVYATSKWQAEQTLASVCDSSAMTYTILRSPLVYGPGVKANFYRLMKLVHGGIPLPFKRIQNRRSLVYVDNLCEVIMQVLDNDIAANKTYLVHDACVSTAELITALADAMHRSPQLFYLPEWLMTSMAGLTGQRATLDRLAGSLELDDSKLRQELGWTPAVSFQDGVRETVEWFLKREGYSD